MRDLFLWGGPIYMTILTALLIMMVGWMVISYYLSKDKSIEDALKLLSYGKSIGFFAFMMGILFHLIGFYQAFALLEKAGEISPGVLFGGLKVSMITTVYGFVIYLLSLIIWFTLSTLLMSEEVREGYV